MRIKLVSPTNIASLLNLIHVTMNEFSLCCLLSSVTHISFSHWNWFFLREFTSPTLFLTKGPEHMCCQKAGWVFLRETTKLTGLLYWDKSQIFSVSPLLFCAVSGPPSVLWAQSWDFPSLNCSLFSVHCRGCCIGFICWSHFGVRFPHSSLILSLG